MIQNYYIARLACVAFGGKAVEKMLSLSYTDDDVAALIEGQYKQMEKELELTKRQLKTAIRKREKERQIDAFPGLKNYE